MKRKFIALATAFLMAISMVLPVSAVDAEPEVYVYLPVDSVSATNKTVDMFFAVAQNGDGSGIKDISVTLANTGELSVISGLTEVSNVSLNKPNRFVLSIPSDIKSPVQYLTFNITYKFNNEERTTQSNVSLKITDISKDAASNSGSVSVQNITFPQNDIIAGTSVTASAEIVNSNSGSITNVSAVLTDTTTNEVVANKYIGTITGSSSSKAEFAFALKDEGTHSLELAVKYTLGTAEKTVKSAFLINIVSSTPLTISNLTYEKTAHQDELQTLTFALINTGNESFLDAQAYIYNGDALISNAYLGTSNAHEKLDGTITYSLSKAETAKLTLKVKYTNTVGDKLYVNKKFEVKVIASEENNDAGSLKIQSITAPASIAIDSVTQIPFYITNPTKTAITGAEITLYDSANNVVDSLFISQADPCTSNSYNFNVLASKEGAETYTAKLVYEDKDKKKITETKSFTVKVMSKDQQGEEAEKPADMRISKINNPTQLYTGANTEIPYTIVNSGKGSAYNVEVYLTDADGSELAREYIGNVAASTKYEDKVKIKINEVGEQELTFGVYFENADGTNSSITKSFSQKIATYRAAITDVSGLEYIYEGSQSNVTFSLLNSGSVNMLNAEAALTDANGVSYGTSFIGTIEANTKKEKIKFKNVMFSDTSLTSLTITVTYENEDADVFTVESIENVTVTPMDNSDNYYPDDGNIVYPDDGMDGDMNGGEIVGYDENGNPIYASSGLPVWAIVLIAVGGAAVVAIVVIVIVKKKKKAKLDDDDMDYFYAQDNKENSEKK